MFNTLKKYKEVILYLVFGVLTTLLNIIIYLICSKYLYLGLVISNIIAWILSVLFAFITNKGVVFKSNKNTIKEIIKEFKYFLGCRLFSGIVDMSLIYLLVNIFLFNDVIVKIFTNIIIIIMNYILSKIIVFKN